MDETALDIHSEVNLRAEVPLLALTGLVCFWIPMLVNVFGGARGGDQCGIDDRTFLHGHANNLEVCSYGFKDLLPEAMLL